MSDPQSTSLEKSKIKFLLLEAVHQSALDTLHRAGYENIEYLKTSLSEGELKERIANVHFVGIRSRSQLTESVFAAAKKLLAVGCFCIGTNQVNLDAALRRGIPCVQCTLFKYAQRRRTCHRPGHPAAARHSGEERTATPGRSGKKPPKVLLKPAARSWELSVTAILALSSAYWLSPWAWKSICTTW
jgi:hypothetical protein